MSYFLSLGTKNNPTLLKNLFYQSTDNSPTGKILCAGNKECQAFFSKYFYHSANFQEDAATTDLLHDLQKYFVKFHSLYLLIHFYSGDITVESIQIKEEKKITMEQFTKIFPDIGADIRYTIVR
jgi:hypothetical protein